jgi:hypothetical protein
MGAVLRVGNGLGSPPDTRSVLRLRHPVKVVNQRPAVDGVDLRHEDLQSGAVFVVSVHDQDRTPEVQRIGQLVIQAID